MTTRSRKKQPTLKIQKTIFQARYKPRLNFYNLVFSAAERFATYADWETDGLSVRLHSYERHCSLNIRHDSFAYEREWWQSEGAADDIQEAVTVLPNALQLSSYTRLGFRRVALVNVDMAFTDLVNLLDLKLCSQEHELRRRLPQNLDDLTYRVDGSDDDFKYHLTMGPVTQGELSRIITVNAKYHLLPNERERLLIETKTRYPEVGILFDFDVYIASDDIAIDQGSVFLQRASERIQQLFSEMTDYLLSRS